MSEQLHRMMKKLEGDGPIEKQIILLKLANALENAPEFGLIPVFDVRSPQRQWLSEVGALLSRIDMEKKIQYRASFSTLAQYWVPTINQISGQVSDAIEELKLELELDGRSDIGNVYAAGDTYRFFADLKMIINQAMSEVLIVDPYFDGKAFDDYLAPVGQSLLIRILAERYAKDINSYIEKYKAQFHSSIELRASKELHDRVVFTDNDSAWIIGGSIKDAGKKAPTYLIPLASPIAVAKKQIYLEIWERANTMDGL